MRFVASPYWHLSFCSQHCIGFLYPSVQLYMVHLIIKIYYKIIIYANTYSHTYIYKPVKVEDEQKVVLIQERMRLWCMQESTWFSVRSVCSWRGGCNLVPSCPNHSLLRWSLIGHATTQVMWVSSTLASFQLMTCYAQDTCSAIAGPGLSVLPCATYRELKVKG